jgi:8-oxo-dGTP pyrophosphatase MutT (NUDIX family)
LVIEHPVAGGQLPGGIVDAGETLPAAALRAAWQQTGALGLEVVGELAALESDRSDRSDS